MAQKPSPRRKRTESAGSATSRRKPAAKSSAAGAKRGTSRSGTKPKAKSPSSSVDPASVEKAKALEALDAAEPGVTRQRKTSSAAVGAPRVATAHPLRNGDFPRTYLKQISVSLDDPDHWMTLTWTGPQAASQETGPFRTSPGAGVKGINCDNATTSRRSGTKCTPKGTRTVEGFQSRLNSDSRATFVTWFMQARGIALHYFPSVPRYAASHGCVRIESQRVAQLIQDNSRVDLTQVVIDGTWTKPAKQW
jgi:hypothetical protein